MIHVYMLEPMVKPNYRIPLAIIFHDYTNNTFSDSLLKENWDTIMKACSDESIKLAIFSSDGETRIRKFVHQALYMEPTISSKIVNKRK